MPVLSDELRERIRAEFPKYPDKRAVTLPALHIVHDAQREVSPAAMVEIAELLELHPSEVNDTMTFYEFFKEEGHALGKHRVWVCRSISCMLRGGEELLLKLSERTGREAGPQLGRRQVHARVRRVPGRLRRGALHAGGRRVSHEFG